ncbi:hypothetical protein [Aristophania vespae]|uniref:hypothetical protein n=1 Tax=Aristophania vespae TaxID=2697033 RepID=UPI002351ADE5|nr:hypothetical protein [Aristophania vespae]
MIKPWRLLPGPHITLPVAVILNRFLTEDFVFILGICLSLKLFEGYIDKTQCNLTARHATIEPGRVSIPALIRGFPPQSKKKEHKTSLKALQKITNFEAS